MTEELELHWLAGLIEGEGCFLIGPPSRPYSPRIRLVMTDRDVVERVARIWGTSVKGPYHRGKNPNWKPTYLTDCCGPKGVEWMERLLPLMGIRRQERIRECLENYRTRPRHAGHKISKEEAAEIKKRFDAGEKAVDLAESFGVTKWTVYAIKQGRRAT